MPSAVEPATPVCERRSDARKRFRSAGPRLAASASWINSVLFGSVQAWRTPCVGRDRSRCRRRPSPRPSACASETVNGRRPSSGGNGARLDMDRDCLKARADARCCPQPHGIHLAKSQKSTKTDRFCVDSCDFTPPAALSEEIQRQDAGRDVDGWAMAPPAGFEPALPPPEGGALSPELRGPTARLGGSVEIIHQYRAG